MLLLLKLRPRLLFKLPPPLPTALTFAINAIDCAYVVCIVVIVVIVVLELS
jgi:hypothetical protein